MQSSDDFTPEVHRRPGGSVAVTGEIGVACLDRPHAVDDPAEAG